MTEKEKMLKGLLYNANYDKELLKERLKAKKLCFKFNNIDPEDEKEQKEVIKIIFGEIGENISICQPFWYDYGKYIKIGDNFFANHNLIILDGGGVEIGDNVFIAPNCLISTATHPIDVESRNKGIEKAEKIVIGNNVWIGGNVSILSGVKIGNNSVVGAGSVVNKDIPSNVVAAGNPCRILRKIDKNMNKK
ncbi:sugar O-acetyltransferase [uncultured Fusobacterium sp.]|uniref:sugar O-acetyltransferase n=1 Tax=uncultured Fusobacterium sp. TaxID=159267 RepID=UPI0015A5B996|nr:sugar O-acetyltransferase [uncultured Fusobacterium sp.]